MGTCFKPKPALEYEIQIATGDTIEKMQESASRWIAMRDLEIRAGRDWGYDMDMSEDMFFKPAGPISFANGLWVMPMMRVKP
jgi:hypothetical protein